MTKAAASVRKTLVRHDLAALLRLAWPVILSRLGIMAMGLTDAIIVGRYSPTELGYQALGWAPTGIVIMTGAGLLTGVQVITARHIGEGRVNTTGGVLRRGLVYAWWLGLFVGALFWLLGPAMMSHVGLQPDLARGSGLVLQVLALSLPFHLIATTATYYLEALSRPKPATIAMWACNLINLAINLWLVPAHGASHGMGAVGASWATVISRAVLSLWLLIYIARMNDAAALGVFRKPTDSKQDALDQLTVGFGGGASGFVEAGAFSSMNLVAGWLGGLAVAGWAVVLNMTALIFMIPLGLSAATAVLVGRAYGAKDRAGLVRAANLGFGVCAAVLAVVAVLVLVFSRAIAGFYSTDPVLIELAGGALMLGSLYFIFDGLQGVAAQALRARGDVLVPTLTHIVSYAFVMVPLAWVLAFPAGLGLPGVVWAVIIASILSAGLLLARFWQLARRALPVDPSAPLG